MEQDNVQEKIKARMKQLPEEVQKAIAEGKLPEKFDAISKKFNLRIDQSGSLQLETLLVMLGLESPDDFVENLMTEAEMSREIAVSVTNEVNTTILSEIRETLREMEEVALAEEDAMSSVSKVNQNQTTTIDRDQTLKGIEDPSIHSNVQINLMSMPSVPLLTDEKNVETTSSTTTPTVSPVSAPAAAPAPSFMNTLMTTPTTSSTEVVQKKPIIDPYREAIE